MVLAKIQTHEAINCPRSPAHHLTNHCRLSRKAKARVADAKMQTVTPGLTLLFLGTARVEDKQTHEATRYQSSRARRLIDHCRLLQKAKVEDDRIRKGTVGLTLLFSENNLKQEEELANSANRTKTLHKLGDDEVRMIGKNFIPHIRITG